MGWCPECLHFMYFLSPLYLEPSHFYFCKFPLYHNLGVPFHFSSSRDIRSLDNEGKSLCYCNFSSPFYQCLSTFKNLIRGEVFTVINSCKLKTDIAILGRSLFLQIVHMKNTGLTLYSRTKRKNESSARLNTTDQ